MDALRRNQYLQTMGVDVWVSRHPPADFAAQPASTAPQVVGTQARSTSSTSEVVATQARSTSSTSEVVGTAKPATSNVLASAVAAPNVADAPIRRAPSDVAASQGGVTTWESLRSEVLGCTRCSLHSTRTQGVFGVGSREAQWLVVGEAPGAEEDRRGEPFVGRAGHLLDAMLKAIGLSRGRNVYIANVLKSRPPGNRDPKPEEVAACLPYLMRQIELLRPRVMLAVGRIAAQNLLSTDVPLGRLRGKVHHFGELNTPLIVTYHPAYLLRTPSDKRKAWEDLKFARSVFQGLNPT
jgi:uracil-DNA glycosylase